MNAVPDLEFTLYVENGTIPCRLVGRAARFTLPVGRGGTPRRRLAAIALPASGR